MLSKKEVLKEVKQDGLSLQFESKELQNDKEVVLEPVKQDGYSLRYASKELKENKQFILEIVKQDGNSLGYASSELKEDKEIECISKKYFKFIRENSTYNVIFHFKYSSEYNIDENPSNKIL